MGSKFFYTESYKASVDDAFWERVESYINSEGDSGYTGTIAEKYAYLVIDRKYMSGKYNLDTELHNYEWSYNLMHRLENESCQLLKDAPAMAFQSETGKWCFFGYASW